MSPLDTSLALITSHTSLSTINSNIAVPPVLLSDSSTPPLTSWGTMSSAAALDSNASLPALLSNVPSAPAPVLNMVSSAIVPDVHSVVAFMIINKDAPNYVTGALEFLSQIEDGGDLFHKLVELWQVFKLCMGYPGSSQVSTKQFLICLCVSFRLVFSQKCDDQLPMEGCPEAIAQWMKVHWSYDKLKLPEIMPETLGPAWMQWWSSMQPHCCHNRNPIGWPLAHIKPEDCAKWNALWKAGSNSLLLALISLS